LFPGKSIRREAEAVKREEDKSNMDGQDEQDKRMKESDMQPP